MDRARARSAGVTQAIVERIQPLAGETHEESFEALYERTFPRVYAYVASILRDRATAEDVTSQAFERAFRKHRSYRSGRGTQEAWVFGIARNAALDELRRRGRTASLEVEPEDSETPSPGTDAELAMRRQAVRSALQELPAAEREVVLLKFLGGLSNAELARVLGTSESNAGTRLHRTITKLREACHDRA